MTEERAESIANVLVGVAAVGAAIYILKTPSLRRVLWQAVRTTVLTTAPAWVAAEAHRGWAESQRLDEQPQEI